MKDGIYTDLSIEEYHKNTTHISASSIKEARKSMRHFKHYFEKETTFVSHFDFGNAFEVALTEPELLLRKVAVFDHTKRPEIEKNFNSKANKEWKAKFFEENSDKYIINTHGDESEELIGKMLEPCKMNSVIMNNVRDSQKQISCFWTDQNTGVKLKTRPDLVRPEKGVIVDIKTCIDASPHAFGRDVTKFDYPIQAAMQCLGAVESGLLDEVKGFYWLAVSKREPCMAELYQLSDVDLKAATHLLLNLFSKIQKAREQNVYPGYSDRSDNELGVLNCEIPDYYFEVA